MRYNKNKTRGNNIFKDLDVLILAGGKGSRMRRIGNYLPKALLPVYNQPLILDQLDSFLKQSVRRIFISFPEDFCCFLQDRIINQVQTASRITIIPDAKQEGPMNALLDIKDTYRLSQFLLILGDIYCEDKRDYFCGLHTKKIDKTNPVVQIQRIISRKKFSGCSVMLDNRRLVKEIHDKPGVDEIKSNFEWTGICYFSAATSGYFSSFKNAYDMRKVYIGDIFTFFLKQNLKIQACPCYKKVINLNTPLDLLNASNIERKLQDSLPIKEA